MTSPTCEQYEEYTLKIDSRFAPANNSFIGYINIPLRNIVKAEVLSVSVFSNTSAPSSGTDVIYLYIQELVSKFNDRMDIQTAITTFSSNTQALPTTSNIGPNLTNQFSNLSQMRTSLVCIPAEQTVPRTVFTSGAYFQAITEFIEPIRQVQQLTVSLYKHDGTLLSVSGPTYLTLKLTCAKRNTCLY
jgi:hypothetical protein